MPFGIKSASEILQKKTYQAYSDIDGVYIIANDMLIAGEDDAEHDQIIHKVLDRAFKLGNCFNKNKIQFKHSVVLYMGRVVSQDGVKAIQDMPDPTEKEGIQRLLGMLNFLASFIPNMSTVTSPLRNLLKVNAPWQWVPKHTAAVNKLKEILSQNPVLKLFNPRLPVTIQADASSTGLGACFMQNSQPVAYTSRSLMGAEMRYAQIEGEMLAIVFAAEQFH